MVREQTEIERKLDVPAGFVLPPLDVLPGVACVDDPVELDQTASYLDTADLRLLRHRVTLRRRTGGLDDGWHLKLPTAGGRLELHYPPGRDAATPRAPVQLVRLVASWSRGQDLVPVVELRTRRTLHRLRDAAGDVIAEVAQDAVTARPVEGPQTAWSELEVEAVAAHQDQLDVVVEALLDAGARPSVSASKLARALGPALEATATADERAPDVGPRSAGRAVRAYLVDQVDALLRWHPDALRDIPDAVHQMRVTTRRLRSALQVYRPLVERDRAETLRAELGWLGRVLGQARDAEVLRDGLLADVAGLDRALVRGPVRSRVRTSLTRRHRTGHRALATVLEGERYAALLDDLDAFLSEPRFTDRARLPADVELTRLVRRQWRKVGRRRAAVEAAEDADAALHATRRAARAGRYAAEVARAVDDRRARRMERRLKGLQSALGRRQDTVVARAALLDLAAEAEGAGESAFTYGYLHARQASRAAAAEADYQGAWQAAARSKVTRWLG
jgi:CHAD domain-containing protein